MSHAYTVEHIETNLIAYVCMYEKGNYYEVGLLSLTLGANV